MKFDFLTIFPDMVSAFLEGGVVARAREKGLIAVSVVNIRDFATDLHRTTDDRPYGGGDGMVMKPEPMIRALQSVERKPGKSEVILLSPQGERFDQAMAWDLARQDQLIFLCGRYEGVDERVRILCADREVSIGDYVLTGGELAAAVVMDAVARLIPGVLGGACSTVEDTFEGGLLEYPHYTRPEEYMGHRVPSVLLSGNHEEIRRWRRRESLRRTLKRRPDLLQQAHLTPEDEGILEALRAQAERPGE